MTDLRVRSLFVSFGQVSILRDVTFDVAKGERLCLLGPSGCGKTTSLRVIAGFIAPDRGEVSIGETNIGGLPPERRNIGILFQNYALFPHLSVYDNIAFGLRMRKVADNDIRRRVEAALSLVRLGTSGRKKPSQLSGGEQQRIAFARAVVIEPAMLLLDEPFSNLDARLRQEMRIELLELLEYLKIGTVMVTHDQEEAMAIANRIAVMNRGSIVQMGSPSEVYERPNSTFVAQFVGESNMFAGDVHLNGTSAEVNIDGLGTISAPSTAGTSGKVKVMIRPEKIRVLAATAPPATPEYEQMRGVLERIQYLGNRTEFGVRVGPHLFASWSLGASPASTGEAVTMQWPKEGVVVFPDEADR
jgi:ABC-type Fe3+/spermidine/putrescine transport system ATPase subunit